MRSIFVLYMDFSLLLLAKIFYPLLLCSDFAQKADLVFAAFCGKSWPNLGKSWKICIEKRCYVKILEKNRTVQKSRRLKIKRTKNLGKKSWSSLYQNHFLCRQKKEDGGGEGKGEAYV
jgi:hypothetical protein